MLGLLDFSLPLDTTPFSLKLSTLGLSNFLCGSRPVSLPALSHVLL